MSNQFKSILEFSQVLILTIVSLQMVGQLQLLNEEFDHSEHIANWSNINQTEGWNIQQLEWTNINDSLAGHFQIAPYTSAWFSEYKGALLYKEITGDFVVTTEVNVSSRVAATRPTSRFSLGGLLIRSPTSNTQGQLGWSADQQDYIFLAAGYANGSCSGACAAQLEVKTTDNSNSSLGITNIGSNRVQLRMARIDSTIVILYREVPSGDWIEHRRYSRPDFPVTIQVGFTTYTDWDKVSAVGFNFHNQNILIPGVQNDPAPSIGFNPTLIADFDFYRLDNFTRPTGFETFDFANSSQVSNADILAFLGYESLAHCPERYDISRPIIDLPYVKNSADTIQLSSTIAESSHVSLSAVSWTGLPELTVTAGATLIIQAESCP